MTRSMRSADILIVGGGFFGCCIALYFAERGLRVILCERSSEVLGRASYRNQARVHNGYHYPRSILTALRSRKNFPIFIEHFRSAIYDEFTKLYAIPRLLSRVSAAQFKIFCDRIDAPARPAGKRARALFDTRLIDDVFEVTEYAFDALKLKQEIMESLDELNVQVLYGAMVNQVRSGVEGGIESSVTMQGGEAFEIKSRHAFNCTYSQLNKLAATSGLKIVPLKHELTEMGLVKVPDTLLTYGITVMCGPFFSIMPFPSKNLHTLSHVRYTPHVEWVDSYNEVRDGTTMILRPPRTRVPLMLADAARYVPLIRESTHVESLWEVKSVLQACENNDSRPILFLQDHGIPNFHSVLGGKIDNIFDCLARLDTMRFH